MKNSILSSLHDAEGARLTPGDAPELLTYGDVPAEYRAGLEGCALFDWTDRGLVLARGADAAEFLHRILANDVRGLGVFEGNRNLLLSPKGKVQFEFDLWRAGEEEFLLSFAGDAAALLQGLDMFLFTEAVELEDHSEAHAPLALTGPHAEEVLRALTGGAAPDTDHQRAEARWSGGALAITRQMVAGSPGFRLEVAPADAAALWKALREHGATAAGLVARDCLRVEAGQALFGVDVDDGIYPQEARLENAFSLDKGCYVGQEVVAKIDTYKGLNKRLVTLAVDHDDPVPRGTRLYRRDGEAEDGDWRDLGVVTSWAYSFVLDTGIVLAYVKRRHQAPGTSFALGELPAEGAEPQPSLGRAEVVAMPVRTGALAVTGEFE